MKEVEVEVLFLVRGFVGDWDEAFVWAFCGLGYGSKFQGQCVYFVVA